MTVNIKNSCYIIGIMIGILGICLVPSVIVAVIYGETPEAQALTITLLLCLVPAVIVYIINKIRKEKLTRIKARDGFFIVTAAWLLYSAITAIPFVVTDSIPDFIDAFFEMCSGYSTTGSTILTDVESLPKSMLFLRSFTHWLGGMGIIVFTTAVLPSIGIEGQMIAANETPGPTNDKIWARYTDNSRNLYTLYFVITVIETILLMLGGMSLYDSLVQTFGTVGTGGFSNYADGIGHFHSLYIYWVITIFMMICGTNFNLYFVLFKRGIKSMFQDDEFKMYISFYLTVSILASIDLIFKHHYSEGIAYSITSAFFHVASIMTTTGYALDDFDLWPTFAKMMLMLVFLTGASSSSTGGGPKIIRILVSLKLIRRGVSVKIHPNRIYPIKVNKKAVPTDVVTNIANFMFFYIAVLFIGWLLISIDGHDLVTSFTAALTCLGNVGPGFNEVGPVCNYSFFSPFSKLVMSFLMIAGRLELFTFFILLSRRYWNSNRA